MSKRLKPSLEPCEDCQALIGVNCHALPHKHLRVIRREYPEPFENHYRCEVCGKYWTYEGGARGMGWIE